ncbi:thiamine pyrophosphate-binding protein [Peribacillus frigoritolerans]|nr:thiamine pyrophosphate-binding protein [Peribacillus frigoritolerans]
MKASDLFVRCLENEGVQYIFGIPGEENTDLIDSLISSDIEFILVHHEQAAAFMADIYGRLTGKPGVCLGTLGTGCNQFIDRDRKCLSGLFPLLSRLQVRRALIASIKSRINMWTLLAFFEEVTKWNQQIKVPHTIPEIIRKAFKTAVIEKPGAVHIELPEDVAMMETEGEPLPVTPMPRSRPAEEEIKKAVELINRSEKAYYSSW